jgi:hypothetical protein
MASRRAPRADIGLWRTATIGTAHRIRPLVRLFGGLRADLGAELARKMRILQQKPDRYGYARIPL